MPTACPARYALPSPIFLRPAQHLDAAELRAERLGLLGGAVGAVVVDDEDVRVGHGLADATDQQLDVLGFVVGRDRDPDAAACRRSSRAQLACRPAGGRAIANRPGRALVDVLGDEEVVLAKDPSRCRCARCRARGRRRQHALVASTRTRGGGMLPAQAEHVEPEQAFAARAPGREVGVQRVVAFEAEAR